MPVEATSRKRALLHLNPGLRVPLSSVRPSGHRGENTFTNNPMTEENPLLMTRTANAIGLRTSSSEGAIPGGEAPTDDAVRKLRQT